MDPYSAAFSAIGSAAAGGPSSAATGAVDQRLYQDGSAWSVATSSGRAEGATIVRSGEEGGALGGAVTAGIAGMDPMTLAIIALVVVVAIKALRK